MENDLFIEGIQKGSIKESEESVFKSIWNVYEEVIVESLITSFGLDCIVEDQYGGDVDTIHNVRNIEKDDRLTYKSEQNKRDYVNREAYNSLEYHQDKRYKEINKMINENKKRGTLNDAYTGKKVARNANIDLDHVIAANEIQNDPGRVLAGLKGTDLANNQDNLKPTDRSINRSMKDKDIDDYLLKLENEKTQRRERINFLNKKDALTDQERKELNKLNKIDEINPEQMRVENETARKKYDGKINRAYYTSDKFAIDIAKAAGTRGLQMGVRQALGFVFAEVWFTAKKEISSLPPGCELNEIFLAVGRGGQKGFENAQEKYKDLFEKFLQGTIAGILASVTTTICNIFFTTARNLVKCIRQTYAAVIQAGNVLLFNPDDLMLGDRIRTSTIILATGASVIVGTTAGELIGKTGVGMLPVIGESVQLFTSTLVSGLISCSLLVFLDRSKLINNAISLMNEIPTEVNNYAQIADILEQLAAKLAKLDIEKFKEDTKSYSDIAKRIDQCENEKELNLLLYSAYELFDITIPWESDFDVFMGTEKNKLVFT